jgi:pilus assembly protein TadC
VDSMLLMIGLGALFLAILVAIAGLTPDEGRAAVSRTVKTANQAYRLTPTSGALRGIASLGALSDQARRLGRALTPNSMLAKLNRRLDQAGNPTWLSTEAALAYKALLLSVGGLVGLFLAGLFASPITFVLWVLAGAVAGFFAPDVLVLHLAQDRQEVIRRTLPDIMDTLVVAVEAGLGFEAALAQVVRNGRGPMVGEFARVLHEMQIGRPRVDALREMAARTSVTELKGFASAVVQATTLGVPMGKVLRQQSSEMRVRRRQRAEEKAQKVPVKILFPTVFCIFPALFVVVLGPGIIRLLNAFAN